ncbi:unnamed protein product [Dicrocoelium dendriticum]|nr:unnamed protein product [Dicrocoelium dendriticum]
MMDDEDSVVSIEDVIKSIDEEKAIVMGGIKNHDSCSFISGYMKRQALYTCLTTCEIPGFEVRMNTVCGESSEEHDDDNSSHESSVKSNCGNRSRSPNDDHPCNGGIGSITSEDDPEKPATVITEPYLSRKKLKQQNVTSLKKSSERNAAVDLSDGWTQVEQKQLEVAIRSIGKEVPERWDRIAECIPTKTKTIPNSGCSSFEAQGD